MPLPSLSREHPPAFQNSAECRDWLAHLPLANPVQAQADLLAQINLLNRYAIAPAERLRVMDLLREPVQFAHDECARRFGGRPVPLSPSELALFDANNLLQQAVATGYDHCLEACLSDGGGQAAVIAQRALAALAAEQLDHYRAGYELAPSFWLRLHRFYSTAEQLGVAEQPVHDRLFDRAPTTPRAAYACVLLMHSASPYELSVRQLNHLRRWLGHWSAQIGIASTPPEGFKLPPLVVDVGGESPGSQLPPQAGNLRWFDLAPLGGKLKRRIHALREGASPESLGLGEDCHQPGCEALLRHTFEHCCKGGIARAQVRRPGQGGCRLTGGVDAIHYYLSGAPFRQPGAEDELTKRQYDEIATFGRVATRELDDYSKRQGYCVETWRLADESPAGLRLVRAAGEGSLRLGRTQLVAVTPPGGHGFLLGLARWVVVQQDDAVHAGLRLFPGAPQPVAMRPVGSAYVRDKWRPGFLLPAVAAVHEPASAVVPATWFRVGRLMNLHEAGAQHRIRLVRLIERGQDFERAEYESA